MGLFNRITSFLDDWHTLTAASPVGDTPTNNPATGLSMTGGIDIAGNPFGIDLSSLGRDNWCRDSWHHDPHCSGSAFNHHSHRLARSIPGRHGRRA